MEALQNGSEEASGLLEARWPHVIECNSVESVNSHLSGLYQCALRMKKPQTRLLIGFLVYALTSRRGIFLSITEIKRENTIRFENPFFRPHPLLNINTVSRLQVWDGAN